MTEKLAGIQDVFLGRVNQMCSRFGLNNIMAQLYFILYFNGNPMSLNEMAERLKVSKGSASINIRALERYGVVRKIWVKGSRKDYYQAEGDIYRVIMDRSKAMVKNRLSEVSEMLNCSYSALDSADFSGDKKEKETLKIFKQRLGELQSIYQKAESLFNLFDSDLLNTALKIKTRPSNKKEVIAA